MITCAGQIGLVSFVKAVHVPLTLFTFWYYNGCSIGPFSTLDLTAFTSPARQERRWITMFKHWSAADWKTEINPVTLQAERGFYCVLLKRRATSNPRSNCQYHTVLCDASWVPSVRLSAFLHTGKRLEGEGWSARHLKPFGRKQRHQVVTFEIEALFYFPLPSLPVNYGSQHTQTCKTHPPSFFIWIHDVLILLITLFLIPLSTGHSVCRAIIRTLVL